ncbi:MAG: AAA family ATPase, partial [Patescibacteria group bacterium]
IAQTIRRARTGIASPLRPLGSFLFLGPTGVGKTETAKALAREIFGSEKDLVRVDMSEFMERHNVARLLGAPPGYVGFEEGGKLTETIRRKPHAVVLFDEIEKAHPDVFNLLLQLLEEGELTDASGRKVNFKNTIIILTSNIGTSEFNQFAIGFSDKPGGNLDEKSEYEKIRATALSALRERLTAELINRIDTIAVFRPLAKTSLKTIAELELQKLGGRLSEQGYKTNFEPELADYLAETSFDPKQGARKIRKNIQEQIESLISEKLLRRQPPKGASFRLGVRKKDKTQPIKIRVA